MDTVLKLNRFLEKPENHELLVKLLMDNDINNLPTQSVIDIFGYDLIRSLVHSGSLVLSKDMGSYYFKTDHPIWGIIVSVLCYFSDEFEEWLEKVDLELADDNTLKSRGLSYGYPECCVDYFIASLDNPDWSEYTLRSPLLGTGYIPCPDCVNKTVEELITVIDGNRDVSLQPFPVEASKDHTEIINPFENIDRIEFIKTWVSIVKLEHVFRN